MRLPCKKNDWVQLPLCPPNFLRSLRGIRQIRRLCKVVNIRRRDAVDINRVLRGDYPVGDTLYDIATWAVNSILYNYSSVVERSFDKAEVEGSRPSSCTIFTLLSWDRLAQDWKSWKVGALPTVGAIMRVYALWLRTSRKANRTHVGSNPISLANFFML